MNKKRLARQLNVYLKYGTDIDEEALFRAFNYMTSDEGRFIAACLLMACESHERVAGQ